MTPFRGSVSACPVGLEICFKFFFILIFSKKWPRSLWSLFNFKNEKSLILPLYIIPNRYMQLGVQSMISNSKNNSYQEKGCGGYSIIPEYGMDIKFKKNLCF
jgi:hypothetical protein